jgi:hypothetical protein
VLVFFSALFTVKIRVPFTNSGELTLGVIEFFGIASAVFLFYYVLKNFKIISKEHKILLYTALGALGVLVLIYLVRVLFFEREMKSLLILESNACVVGVFFLAVFKIIPIRRLLSATSGFGAVLGFISVLLLFFVPLSVSDWVLFSNSGFYVLLLSNAVRTVVLLICLPLSAMNYLFTSAKASAIFFYIHLISVIVCGMISGARVNYICIPVAIIALAVIFFKFKKKNKIRTSASICGVFVATVIAVFAIAPFHMLTYTQLTRLDVSNSVLQTFDITYVGDVNGDDFAASGSEGSKTEFEEKLEQATTSAGQSATSRKHMWALAIEDIKQAPFFGNGTKQYQFTFNNGTTLYMQPHNFILEYLLGFGFVGLMVWLIMMGLPELLMLKKIKFRFWNHYPICLLLCSLFFAFSGAIFQPYFLYPGVMFFVFLAMGGCYTVSDEMLDTTEKVPGDTSPTVLENA